jgi:hypothetical protein
MSYVNLGGSGMFSQPQYAPTVSNAATSSTGGSHTQPQSVPQAPEPSGGTGQYGSTCGGMGGGGEASPNNQQQMIQLLAQTVGALSMALQVIMMQFQQMTGGQSQEPSSHEGVSGESEVPTGGHVPPEQGTHGETGAETLPAEESHVPQPDVSTEHGQTHNSGLPYFTAEDTLPMFPQSQAIYA